MPYTTPPEVINTKVAGIASGTTQIAATSQISPVDANGRIPVRQYLAALMRKLSVSSVRLVREPTNEFDSDAIAVYANLGAQSAKIGYIRNHIGKCVTCGRQVIPFVDTCPKCNGKVVRRGLATELSHWIDRGVRYRARVIGITGGGDRRFGVSLKIERIT